MPRAFERVLRVARLLRVHVVGRELLARLVHVFQVIAHLVFQPFEFLLQPFALFLGLGELEFADEFGEFLVDVLLALSKLLDFVERRVVRLLLLSGEALLLVEIPVPSHLELADVRPLGCAAAPAAPALRLLDLGLARLHSRKQAQRVLLMHRRLGQRRLVVG